MTIDEILSIRDAAMAAGDVKRYELAWVALGYHRHPGFMPATADEREAAVRRLEPDQKLTRRLGWPLRRPEI